MRRCAASLYRCWRRAYGYAGDITRTYAAAGHDEFQSFIDAVDAAQLKMCAAVRAGFDYKQLHIDAHLSLMGILKDFGVITVSPEAALKRSGIAILPTRWHYYLIMEAMTAPFPWPGSDGNA